MDSLKFIFKKIKELTSPCHVTISGTYLGYGRTYILMGFDEEKQKFRLRSASNPYNEDRFVDGNLTVVVDVKFYERGNNND